ncbi:hypothetical protein HBI70_055550 [Parastagonospora nodorum]|nr:hypothetical protein HBH51_051260 [Parastagonospora nodorum]KAH4038399.1 hypothetical protein HBI09_050830 [Parastagonospora nodorum]KAH4055436.1 hypothetical protein HBH49_059250 [Parastagonospora nodorum]KAH4071860.1 hypothetical protein HBH50_069600 [Parastagonospora nodorum]KAH4094744.1 hypothetical protein HBH48_057870 [Parastagonospora nodorum]
MEIFKDTYAQRKLVRFVTYYRSGQYETNLECGQHEANLECGRHEADLACGWHKANLGYGRHKANLFDHGFVLLNYLFELSKPVTLLVGFIEQGLYRIVGLIKSCLVLAELVQ